MANRFLPTNLRGTTARPRNIVWLGALLVVVALLLNSAGLAIVIAALVAPIAVLVDLSRRDLVETEPWWSPLAMAAVGAVVALFVTLLNILVLRQFESETDPSSHCCGLFLGKVDLEVRDPGVVSYFLVGLLLPVAAEVLKAAAPLYLRQQPRFRNEVMDGVTLGAAVGGGYAAAAAIVYFWPLVNGSHHLGGSVSGWTSALIALLVVRPLIWCATTALVCAGVWHYALQPRTGYLLVPVGSAAVGAVILAIGTLVLADRSTLVQLIWNGVVLFGLVAASRYVLDQALGRDRLALASSAAAPARITCPTCGRPTRPGAFCTNCGAPLQAAADPTPATEPRTPPETEPPADEPSEPDLPTASSTA
jgi:RsiW-degrading membrane proteinase PrsW (M82 family)